MKISEVHKIKKLLDEVKSFRAFKAGFPILKPFLKLLGADTSSIEDNFKDIENLSQQIEIMASVPDHFNDIFSSLGWILFERMSMDIAKEAISKAEAGNIEEAERILVSYFKPSYVKRELNTMVAVKAFQSRMDLTQKALIDYEEARYHACIPVILAQIDGLVSELHELQRGFFAKDADFDAWDSIAAHSKGLNQLSAIFRKGRRKTNTETIDIPYRHGIMHGRDLGYANKKVAAKTWAALFAVREWAIKAERGELEQPPDEPEIGMIETIEKIVELNREKERWEKWQPRSIDISSLPKSPDPNIFQESTPERALSEFLHWWSHDNYGYMAKYLPNMFSKCPEDPLPVQVRNNYESVALLSYEITNFEHSVAGLSEIKCLLKVDIDSTEYMEEISFRMIFEDTKGEIVSHGNPSGKWVVMNWNSVSFYAKQNDA